MGVSVTDFAIRDSGIEGLTVIDVKQVTDERGTIRELFRRSAFEHAGIDLAPFRQVNVTETRRGAVRGMHAEAMTKLCSVVSGEALGAWIDLRRDSPTWGHLERVRLVPGVQVLVPAGVANGFQGVSDISQYAYCFDDEWQPGMPGAAISPLDPDVAFDWPIRIDPNDPAQISVKDRDAPTLAELKGAT